MSWYAVQTKSGQEEIAELNLKNQEYEAFLPKLRVSRHRRGRWQPVIEALFPGYLFVNLDLEEQNTAPIRSTRGVVQLVRQGATLVPVPNNVIDYLLTAQEAGCDAIERKEIFKPGDEVDIVSGPMAGLKAVFKAKNSQERVILLLNIIGNETLTNVPQNQIALAS